MDDEMDREPETPDLTVPMLTGAALPEFLKSEDSALANVLRRLVDANDEVRSFGAFGSTP